MKSNEDKIKDSLSRIESWVEDGLTDKEIAEKLGMSYSTFRRYKKENVDLKAVIAQGKDKKNEKVEQSLYKLCNGYKYTEEVAMKVKKEVVADDGQTILVQEEVEVKPVKKYKGPDLAAQRYWLNNKKKSTWSDDPNKVANDKKLTKLKEKEINNKSLDL